MGGVLRVLHALGMREHADEIPPPPSFEAVSAAWVRAAKSGIFHLNARTGDQVKRGQQLGFLTTPFGESAHPVKAPYESVVIGHTSNPLVYRGDALLHLARRMPARRNGDVVARAGEVSVAPTDASATASHPAVGPEE